MKFVLSPRLKKAIATAQKETVFHLHGGFLPQLFMVSRFLKKYQHNYIYTPHGAFNSEAIKRSKWKKQLYVRLFEKFVVSNARYVHAIGKSEISGTQSIFGSSQRIELVPNGHRSSSSIFPKVQNNGEKTNFGFIGRLDAYTKGLDILLDGFNNFLMAGGHGALHIAGSGGDEERIKSYVEQKGLTQSVVFYGALFGDEKDQFLSGLDYLCLTSRHEGIPGVVLEALETQIPCIVSQETNMGDFIEKDKAGFVLEVNDPRFLTRAMLKAVKARETRKYGKLCENACQLVKEQFQWSRISDVLIQKFHEG
jgi:glycosyltransferase involved in cell wall biosynthesis